MKRHRTDPNILVESMPCGCRLEIPIEFVGQGDKGGGRESYSIIGLLLLYSAPLGSKPVHRFAHLFECEDHAK